MSDVIKVAATGIIASVCAVMLRKQVPELALLIVLCAGSMILLLSSGAFSSARDFVDKISDVGGLMTETMVPVLRTAGIALITRVSSDLCKDAGEGALASAVEIAGAMIGLVAVLPLMAAVLELLGEML